MESLQSFSSLCAACLTSDRKTYPVENKSFFLQLMADTDYKCPEMMYFCWECAAQIKNFLNFQEKFKKAQIILQLSAHNITPTLSNLAKSSPHIVDITPYDQETQLDTDTSIEVPFTIINEVPDTIIKEEDDFDYADNSSLVYVDQAIPEDAVIKTEKNVNHFRRHRYTSKAETVKNLAINWNDPNVHFVESLLSEEEILVSGSCYGNTVKKRKKQKICSLCDKVFDTELDANRHRTYVHILNNQCGELFKCLACKEKCIDVDSLRDHWVTRHNKVMRCKYCQQVVSPFTASLKQHLLKHLILYTCKECDDVDRKTYISYQDFAYHYNTLHSNYYCDYCQKKKPSKSSLIKHMRSLHVQPICKVCYKTFYRYQNLRSHLDSVHPELSGQKKPELSYCVECNKQFGSTVLYKKHVATTKAHNSSIYKKGRKISVPCPECERVFTRTTYMRNHWKQVHTQQSEHSCVLCNKTLFSAWSLKQHIAGVHMKIRAPKDKICDYCGYAFSTNSQLTKHRRTHTGERPYRCSHCPAAFTQCTPLKSHLRTQHKVLNAPIQRGD